MRRSIAIAVAAVLTVAAIVLVVLHAGAHGAAPGRRLDGASREWGAEAPSSGGEASSADAPDARPGEGGPDAGSGPDDGSGAAFDPTANYSQDPEVHETATRLMSVDAEYDAGRILVTFPRGTTASAANEAIAGCRTLAPATLTQEQLDDGIVLLAVADGYKVEDAVVELSATGLADIVQPNYHYEIAIERDLFATLALDVGEQVAKARAAAIRVASTGAEDAAATGAEDAAATGAEGAAAWEDPATPDELLADGPDEVAAPFPEDFVSDFAELGAQAADGGVGGEGGASTSDETTAGAAAGSAVADADGASLETQSSVSVNDFDNLSASDRSARTWHLNDVKAFDAWSYLPAPNGSPSNGVRIAVLDDGFATANDDLENKIVARYNATNGGSDVSETAGHGTHVAGIAGAESNNGRGTAGVSYNAGLVLAKVKDSAGKIKTEYLARGYDYVMDNRDRLNIRVVNLSIGSKGKVSGSIAASDRLVLDKVESAFRTGVVSVMAACNNKPSDGAYVPYDAYPSDSPYAVSVINLAKSGNRNVKSNYNVSGSTAKNISAPGTEVYSTKGLNIVSDSGTSMASPVVAGVFSLVFARRPDLTASQARAVVYCTATDIGTPGWDRETGYGKANALAAMENVAPSLSGPSEIEVGGTGRFSLANGSPKGASVTWSSSSRIATVDSNGVVTTRGVGTVTITATFTERDNEGDTYTGSASRTVSVRQTMGVGVAVPGQTYDGTALRPSPRVTMGSATLVEGTDYVVDAYYDNVNVGTAWVVISGRGRYTGRAAGSFAISARDISGASVAADDQAYTGRALVPAVTVRLGERALRAGTDYSVSYTNNVLPGTATATVYGRGNYAGSARTTFQIVDSGVPMQRLYNPNSGEHFYTASEFERDSLVAVGWSHEGVGWVAPSSGEPVFRLYNPYAGDHHYTTSEGERDSLVAAGWSYEGEGWRSGGGTPLWRQYNPNAATGSHNYTTSEVERDTLVSIGWHDEGVGWYGIG